MGEFERQNEQVRAKHFEIANSIAEINRLETLFESELPQSIDPDTRDNLKLRFRESLTNAFEHGNQSDPNKKIFVDWDIHPNGLKIEIEDQGQGFNPDSVPDPLAPENILKDGGRGLLLIKTCYDISFNEKGNKITMIYPKQNEAE